jgi:hypothetical protein
MSLDVDDPPNNGAILNVSKIMTSVNSSAADAELGALYINACKAVAIHNLLNEMGHKQPKTPMQTDNSTALGVVNSNIQPRRTKSMDMRYYWLRCRDSQGQFRFYWKPGPTNKADYYTKHVPASHHVETRPKILTPKLILDGVNKPYTSNERYRTNETNGFNRSSGVKYMCIYNFKNSRSNSQLTLKGCVGSRD